MASWTVLDNEARNHAVTTTQNTTATITPAVGDIIFFGGTGSAGANAAVSGGGMTWTQLALDAAQNDTVNLATVGIQPMSATSPGTGVVRLANWPVFNGGTATPKTQQDTVFIRGLYMSGRR
jgi:hypothetical protein